MMASTKKFPEITHIIFDMDGLLLDTETIYTKVMDEIASKYGKKFTWTIKSKMMGKKHQEVAQIFVDSLCVPISPEEYMVQEMLLARPLWPQSVPLPGVVDLVSHFYKHQIPQAVGTSSSREIFSLKTKNHPWFAKFSTCVFGDDSNVKHGKPAPDIFLEAARRLEVQPSKKVLVFEDALNGVQSAIAAGMSVVAIPYPQADKSLFHEADLVLNSMEEFDPTLFNLPSKYK